MVGCDLYSETSALEQIVLCHREYRICTAILASETKSWLVREHGQCLRAVRYVYTHTEVHDHTPLNHFWLVGICDIQHSLVNVCL